MGWSDILFYCFAALTVGSAAMVAFSRNIVRSAFSLLGTFFGVAGLYAILSADLLAALQVLIYVGGILVLILFAVMLTHKVDEVRLSNKPAGVVVGILVMALVAAGTVFVAWTTPWATNPNPSDAPTTGAVGDLLLSQYVLPFEIVSLVLIVVLVGAVALVRKEEDK